MVMSDDSVTQDQIGTITFYSGQPDLICQRLSRRKGVSKTSLERLVFTVDLFQGQERDLYSRLLRSRRK